MGQGQSILKKKDYKIERETENGCIATKDDDRFFVRQIKISTNAALISKMATLQSISHPHVMSSKHSFEDEDQNTYYAVMEYCQGGTLAEKIRGMSDPPQEFEVLSWIVEICMALKTIHEKSLLHKAVMPQNIFLTDFGQLCLGGFWNICENSNNTAVINYLPPEAFTQSTYDTKSEIWSVGCILYELCSQQSAFSAENNVSLIQKITCGPEPCLQGEWSSEFHELLSKMLNRDPDSRPTACEILELPITLRCLLEKSKTTMEHLQTQLDKLKDVADGLESIHKGATIGSLTGGVIGAVGGITSIVCIALAPFISEVLLIAKVGVGVRLAGGVTAVVSNITNIVNQSFDRKTVWGIIKEFDEKINAVALWLEEISTSLQAISSRYSGHMPADADSSFNQETRAKIGRRVGKGKGELYKIMRMAASGKIAAQLTAAARVTAIAVSALSALFVVADYFFISMEAKEIHRIRQTTDGQTRSEIIKFVQFIRQSAKELQGVLDELKIIIRQLEWQEME